MRTSCWPTSLKRVGRHLGLNGRTWSVWGGAAGPEEACGPSAASELRSAGPTWPKSSDGQLRTKQVQPCWRATPELRWTPDALCDTTHFCRHRLLLTVAVVAGVDVSLQRLSLGELGQHFRQVAGRLRRRLPTVAVVALGELQRQVPEGLHGVGALLAGQARHLGREGRRTRVGREARRETSGDGCVLLLTSPQVGVQMQQRTVRGNPLTHRPLFSTSRCLHCMCVCVRTLGLWERAVISNPNTQPQYLNPKTLWRMPTCFCSQIFLKRSFFVPSEKKEKLVVWPSAIKLQHFGFVLVQFEPYICMFLDYWYFATFYK